MSKYINKNSSTDFFGSAQRIFRRKNTHGILATSQVNAHTLRDIGAGTIAF